MAIQPSYNRNPYTQTNYPAQNQSNYQQYNPPQSRYPQPLQNTQQNQKIPDGNKKLLLRILFITAIILILVAIILLIKYQLVKSDIPSTNIQESQTQKKSSTTSTAQQAIIFDEEYCMSLLRNHQPLGEITFTESGPVPSSKKAILNGIKENNIIVNFEQTSEGLSTTQCQLSYTSPTKTDFTVSKNYLCVGGITIKIIESSVSSYNFHAIRTVYGSRTTDIISYSNPSRKQISEIKNTLINNLKCQEEKQ